MRGLGAIMSSATDEWMTPPDFLARVRQVGPIEVDPCTSDANPTGASRWFTQETDGLAQDWGPTSDDGLVFVNPPYSDMAAWALKVHEQAQGGLPMLVLVPARTDTKWFHQIIRRADEVCLWRGRIRFLQPDGTTKTGAPFPSVVLKYGPIPSSRFSAAFGDAGLILHL